ncbi:hypothetical protein G6514_006055 [Epicoccum nigrum]|nr:hypothetical protein G6514_006055 [Epicoccum nigrum]
MDHGPKYIAICNKVLSPLLRLPTIIRKRIFELATGGFEITLSSEWPESPLVHRQYRQCLQTYMHEAVYPDATSPQFWKIARYSGDTRAPPAFSWYQIAALNQTCTQTRRETAGMHFALNAFVGSPAKLERFLARCEKIGQAHYVRSVVIDLPTDADPRTAFTLPWPAARVLLRLCDLPALQRVQ